MSTLEIEVGNLRPASVAFTATELVVTLADGRRIATPLDWYPRLKAATTAQRQNFEIMPMGVHLAGHRRGLERGGDAERQSRRASIAASLADR
jgi:hypothetical protein